MATLFAKIKQLTDLHYKLLVLDCFQFFKSKFSNNKAQIYHFTALIRTTNYYHELWFLFDGTSLLELIQARQSQKSQAPNRNRLQTHTTSDHFQAVPLPEVICAKFIA